MKRAIEILKRRRWWFIVPFVIVFVVPAVLSLIFLRNYEANSLIWLDSNTSLATALSGQGAGVNTENPIQAEADSLRQLLQSRAFMTKVIAGTPLQSKMGTPRQREKTIEYVRENMEVAVIGPNSARITFLGRSPEEAVAVVKTTTGEFLERVRATARVQGKNTITLFSEQSELHRKQLEEARAELQAFKEKHPETAQLDLADRVLSAPRITASPAVQNEYLRLRTKVDYTQELYTSSLTALGQAQMLSALEEERYTNGFDAMDEPVEPVSFSERRMLLADFLAFVAAVLVGGVAVLVAEYNDHTLHSASDVKEELDLPVLAEIPQIAKQV